jgi:hypothetical protein
MTSTTENAHHLPPLYLRGAGLWEMLTLLQLVQSNALHQVRQMSYPLASDVATLLARYRSSLSGLPLPSVDGTHSCDD